MPSPFPGMDPFIESQKWEDFHATFIAALREAIVPSVRPKYVVEVERRVYLETRDPDSAVQGFIVDAGILDTGQNLTAPDMDSTGVAVATEVMIKPKLCTVPYPEEHREAFLTIRHGSPAEIVTVIELLSPTNKLRRASGREQYLDKRLELLQTKAHLVELDLLRSGEAMPLSDPPDGDYFAMVSRARRRPSVDVYGWSLSHVLPTIPIPLAGDDPDVRLNLQAVFNQVYDRAGYDYSIDYTRDAQPQLTDAEAKWAADCLNAK